MRGMMILSISFIVFLTMGQATGLVDVKGGALSAAKSAARALDMEAQYEDHLAKYEGPQELSPEEKAQIVTCRTECQGNHRVCALEYTGDPDGRKTQCDEPHRVCLQECGSFAEIE